MGDISTLADVLPKVSEESLATYAKRDRKRELAEQGAENRAKLEACREQRAAGWERKKSVRRTVSFAMRSVGLPPVGKDLSACTDWVRGTATWFSGPRGRIGDAELAPLVEGELRELMAKQFWEEKLIDQAVAHLMKVVAA